MRAVKTIGIVCETVEDAQAFSAGNIDTCYHWREPEELAAICGAVERLGFTTIVIGPPAAMLDTLHTLRHQLDFIMNLSVGFLSRFRLAAGPSLFELTGIPYSGADPYAKQLSQSKHLQKSFFDKLGLPTPPWTFVGLHDDLDGVDYPPFPLILKPAHEGSSIGIDADSIVRTSDELRAKTAALRDALHMPIIAEHFIIGREIKVGMIGNESLAFDGIIEDIHPDGSSMGKDFLHFGVKKKGAFGKVARSSTDPMFHRLLHDCKTIYAHFCPVDYGTFDIRMDEAGNHYFLEFNADATLHPHRTLAQCCQLNGLAFDGMIESILRSAFKRQALEWK